MAELRAEALQAALDERVLPVVGSYARRLFAQLGPGIVPTVGAVVVPARAMAGDAFAVRFPAGRSERVLDGLLDSYRERQREWNASADELLRSRVETPGYISARVVGERVFSSNVGDHQIWSAAGTAALIGDFDIIPVLGVSTAALDVAPIAHIDDFRLSLFTSLSHIFLDLVSTELARSGAEGGFHPRENYDDMLRDAGESMMMVVHSTLFPRGGVHPEWNLLEQMNQICAQKYERAIGHGSLIFARESEELLYRFRFRDPVPIDNPVWSRKTIELCTDRSVAVSNDYEIFGLIAPECRKSHFSVEFVNETTWRLRYDEVLLMEVIRGVPRHPRQALAKDQFTAAAARVIPSTSRQADSLWSVIQGARQQSHGVVIVITPDAAAEAARLAKQATPIEPTVLDLDQIKSATSIDGALLLDPDGRCHAIGVILDGNATPQATPARGARFNSALRYVMQHQSSLALVVSDDGHTDLLPRLRPQILRAEFDETVELIRGKNSRQPSRSEVERCLNLASLYSYYLDANLQIKARQMSMSLRSFDVEERETQLFDPHSSDIIDREPR